MFTPDIRSLQSDEGQSNTAACADGTLQVQHRILHLCKAMRYSQLSSPSSTFLCHQTTATETSKGYFETL